MKNQLWSKCKISSLIFSFVAITAFAISVTGQVGTAASIGLAEWWTADNNAFGTRNRNNGTLQNGASYASGKVGNAFNFDGFNDYVSIPKTNNMNFGTGDFSVEFWVKWNSVGFGGMMSGDNYGAAGDYNGWLFNDDGNSGGIGLLTRKASVGNAEARIAASNFTNGVWYHLAGVRTGRTLQLYVNGILAATGTESSPIDVSNNYEIRIGSLSAAAPQYFGGQIDEPSLYNRALSASEIQNIFNAGSVGKSKPTAVTAPTNQIAWFAGDGNANDLSGNGNNGTLQNGAAFAVGNVGQSFMLDGTDDYLSVAHSPSLAPTNLTIEGCFNFSDVSGAKILVAKSTVGSLESYIIYYSGGTLNAAVGSPGGLGTVISTSFSPTVNAWYHISYTFDDASNTQKLFINGVQSVSGTTNDSIVTDSSPLLIGAESSGVGQANFFAGKIDEVSLYDRALTTDEIASIYNVGQAGKLKQTTTTGTNATVGDVSLNYPNSATRRTQVVPLDENDFPALPGGMTSTGLLYDISTDVLPTGNTDICFSLPSFASLSSMEFDQRRVLHLENGEWTNRTLSRDFTDKIICARTPSLSPFAIVDSNIAPTAADISVSGRITNKSGNGISNVRVSITDENGNVRNVSTNSLGYYRFDEIEAGQTYVLAVSSKRYQFDPPTQIIYASDDLSEINFTAIE